MLRYKRKYSIILSAILIILSLSFISALTVNSTNPINNRIFGNSSINFTADISGGIGIQNATIFIYNTTGLYNQTNINILLAPLSATVESVIYMIQGVYTWFWHSADILNTQADSSNSTLIIECGTLSKANTIYIMNQSFNAKGTCFTITANNITLDGNGYTITGNTTNYGVLATSRNNLTIRNMNIINFSYGVYFSSTSNSTINNNIIRTSQIGIYLFTLANNNQIISNTLITNGTTSNSGIIIQVSSNNNIINSNNISTYGTTLNNYGISLTTSSSNNTIINNIIRTNGTISNYGIHLSASYNNNITNNNILTSGTGSSNYGIFFIQTENNTITTNNISTSGTTNNEAFFFAASGTLAKNDNLTNNILDSIKGIDLYFGAAGMNGTYIIDQPIRNYTFIGNGGKINFKSTIYGTINFLNAINGSGSNLSADVQIGDNFVYVNSTKTGLNKTANITLLGLPVFDPVAILRDGIVCNTTTNPSCYNFTSLTAGTVIFNVSSWTNYSIGFTGDASPPKINITYPLKNVIYGVIVTQLNYTTSDANPDSCWYSLNLGSTNISITCGTNVTGLTSSEGSNTWRVYANDSLGFENYSSVTFIVDLSYLDLIFKPSSLIIVGTQSNVTGVCIPELNCSLYRNNTLVNNSDIQTLMLGNYFYSFNTTGNENFTAQDINGTLRVVLNYPCAENKFGFFNINLPHIIRDGCS